MLDALGRGLIDPHGATSNCLEGTKVALRAPCAALSVDIGLSRLPLTELPGPCSAPRIARGHDGTNNGRLGLSFACFREMQHCARDGYWRASGTCIVL